MRKGEGTYNAVVIGAGAGGLVSAAGLSGLGARVALVEKGRMGGDCLNTGCVPSKALIRTARAAHQFRTADRYGLSARDPEPDLDAAFARMRAVREAIAPHDSVERFEGLGVDVFHGAPARFLSPHEIQVDDLRLRADHAVIATGGRPAVPRIEGLDTVPFHTSETLFDEMKGSPGSVCILGAGPIGCELSQVMARLGVSTTTVEASDQVLPREDPDAASVIAEALRADGVDLRLGHTVTRVERGPGSGPIRATVEDRRASTFKVQEFGALIIAVGKRPSVEGLDLEAAGVKHGPTGVQVDDYLRTTRRHIYAVGDVVGPYQFTHFADSQARAVIRNILIPWWPARFDARVMPWCTFTDPECARVGLNEAEAGGSGAAYQVHRFELADLDRAICDSETRGFVKVLADPKGRILGATCVGAGAGDWIHEYVLAMKHGITLGQISGTTHIYPTYAEAARRPADSFMRGKLTPRAARLLAWRWGRR